MRTELHAQLRYELPHRVYTAVSFPKQASNGSRVFLYGHESGVRVLWRGGRGFKTPPSQQSTKSNGAGAGPSNDSVMIIDSDDEEPPAIPPIEFEDKEDDINPQRPFPSILQYIDISLNTAATTIVTSTAIEDKIVFAATCTDNKIRLVTLPLTPPSPSQKAGPAKKGKYSETIQTLEGFSSAPDLVAVTYIKSNEPTAKSSGSLLVAGHSRSVTGVINLYQILIQNTTKVTKDKDGKMTSNTTVGLAASDGKPSHSQYLSCPATSLDFSSSAILLLGDRTGAVRLFDPSRSAWLAALYAPFSKSASGTATTRKPILSSKWVLDGHAILVLLNDGEWGIWDLYGTGPGSAHGASGSGRSLMLSAAGNSIHGGAITPFALGGYIDGPPVKSSSRPELSNSKFAPMTPHTRKVAAADLSLNVGKHGANAGAKGGVDVVAVKRGSSSEHSDERVTLWIGESYHVIESLRSFWEGQTRKGGDSLFGGRQSRMKRLEGVNLSGEKCQAFVFGEADSEEVVVVAEHRLVLVKDRPRKDSGNMFKVSRVVEKQMESMDLGASLDPLEELERGMDMLEERRERSVSRLSF